MVGEKENAMAPESYYCDSNPHHHKHCTTYIIHLQSKGMQTFVTNHATAKQSSQTAYE